jgi:hypothetical protein
LGLCDLGDGVAEGRVEVVVRQHFFTARGAEPALDPVGGHLAADVLRESSRGA